MSYPVKCIFCEKEWQTKEPVFLTACGVCTKQAMLAFEAQFCRKLLKAKVIRVEE